jgi:predicted 3-demethylubiquinone-9 3-methyltransferase (glyoxalase superfamily)
MQKITPFLWFDNNAEEAVRFYTSVFADAKVLNMVRYTNAGPGPEGAVMTAVFELHGQRFIALNGGPKHRFTDAVSFVVNCETQEEVDMFWEKLSEGGEKSRCGWLKDKFGLSWQVVPTALPRLLNSQDPEQAKRVMEAMMQMDKIEISLLEAASNGEETLYAKGEV